MYPGTIILNLGNISEKYRQMKGMKQHETEKAQSIICNSIIGDILDRAYADNGFRGECNNVTINGQKL